mmetsp:Transcript_55326/g.160584  ORF Transcript_55326/g.160584 Transcript_55326/m.160584 type:complete len:406 (-) Transcript_55326:100-1317(-)
MGAGLWGSRPSPPRLEDCVPKVRRETSTLAEKEAALEMEFFAETCRLKEFAATGNNLERLLRREDNSAFAMSAVGELCDLPVDADGFVRSFVADDHAGIRDFFERFGLVVVHSAIDESACHRSISEVWEHVERECPGVDRADPCTWDRWPPLAKLGILGNTFFLSAQFCENRQAPGVYNGFRAVFGRDSLVVNVGRASVMRPTRGVPVAGEGEVAEGRTDRPEWRTAEGETWLHWDLNPFTGASSTFSWKVKDLEANRGYSRLRVQAVLALSDCGPEDGGFFCVPGSHRALRAWAHENREAVSDGLVVNPESAIQLRLPAEDPMKRHAQKVPIRKGSLLIWNAQLAHCNFPNDSSQARIVQYIQMAEADDPVMAPLCASEDYLPPRSEFDLSELGRKLYGFSPWP